MSNAGLSERLDIAISAMLMDASAEFPLADMEAAELLGIAAELRWLPAAEFKARLKSELEKEITMTSTAATKPAVKRAAKKMRAGFRTVTPYLTVPDVFAEIEFIKRAFGAEGQVYGLGSAGGYHSEHKIGDSMIMIGGGGGKSKWKGEPATAALHLYVENTDEVYQRSIQAGAKSLVPPTDMMYGERSAAIEDVAGNHWYLATAFGKRYVPQGLQNLMPVFHPRGAKRLLDFLASAFAAKPLAVHQTSKGVVKHAQVRIGNSIVEMGEAHGQWQPRAMHFMLYVDDSDKWYARAMKAEGAISVHEPSDQPYGARVGTIKDPFDNVWYLATQLAGS